MKGAFAQYHPAVGLAYYIAVIFLAAVIRAPLFLLCALLAVIGVNRVVDGGQAFRRYAKAYLVMAALMAVLNPLFSHRGATALFELGENTVTLEAVVYGLTAAMSLLVIVWSFVSFNLVITGDKFLYLFGRAARQSALVAMMALAFIPRLRQRLEELALAQRTRSREDSGSWRQRGILAMELVGALTAWTLEDGAATAQSMTARGYGLQRRRSFYSRYRWQRWDGYWLGVLAALLGTLAFCWPKASAGFAISPRLSGLAWSQPVVWLALGCYVAVLALPVGMQLWEEGRFWLWQRRYGSKQMPERKERNA